MKYIFRIELGDRLEEIVSLLKELPENRWLKNFAPVVKYLSSAPTKMTPEEVRKKLEAAVPKNRGGIMQTLAEVWKQEGLQQGLQQGQKTAAEIVLSQLKWRFGQISARAEKQILRLPLSTLKELGDALPVFAKPSDLTAWLREHAPKRTA